MQILDKPKKQLTEEQLRRLAENRQKGIITRQKNAVVKKAEKVKKAREFESQYQAARDVVEGEPKPKPEPVAEHVQDPEPTYDPPAPAPSVESSDEEPSPPPRRRGKKATYAPEPKMSAKEQYYSLKARLLEQQQRERQEELETLLSYSRAPVSRHAYDVAANSLKSRVDQKIYQEAYKSIFPYD